MTGLLAILDSASVETPGLMKYLSSHPETRERIDRVKENIIAGDGNSQKNPQLQELFAALKKEVE